jgi:nucleoside-diphosphate-sugar epimerase
VTEGFYRGKRAVVTGAGGFIGSHLVEALVAEGARVRALVRYTSSYSYVAPHQYVATNVHGTLNVLDAAREHGARVVHTSTSETYGTARYTPIDEAHPVIGQSPYSATKIGADKLAESYHLSFGLEVATIRPFNTYGPRQSSRAIIPTLMKQLAAGASSIRIGSTTPVRDLNFVTDTVAGFLAIGASARAVGQTLNVGSGRAISMGELAELILRITGKRAELVSDEARVRPGASEVMMLLASCRKAAELVGYAPRVPLEEGLARTYAYIEQHIAEYRPDEYTI